MERLTSPPRLMIVSDLDDTMVEHRNDNENHSLLRFNSLWEEAYRHDSLLVFSTGRAKTMYKKLRKARPLLTPDVIVTSVGTEISYGKSMVPDENWVEIMNNKWNRGIVEEETRKFPELTLQAETEQMPHKLSFHVDKSKVKEVTKELYQRLEKRGLEIKIIFSGGIALDVLPKGGGKGQALAYLLKKLKTEGKLPLNTLVCGDSGNDTELFTIPNVYGVMVSNAREELLEWYAANGKDNSNIIHACERCAGGIIEAIGHFKLGPKLSPRDVSDFLECKADNVNPGHAVVEFFLFYERWRRGEIENCAAYTKSLKASCDPAGVFVHPSGAEKSLRGTIDELGKYHGDKKDKKFRVWTDQVLATETTHGTWIVKLDKWEQTGNERKCCTTTVKFTSKENEGFVWENVQQTWSEESEPYFFVCLFMVSSIAVGGDSKKMEAEPKDSLSAADLDMPSLELRSTETFNRGSASDLSMFSSSLPTLLHENLNMTDSDSWLSLDDKLGVGNSENDSLEEDVEPDSLETLLPEDENELLPGLIDELNFNGLPDELEECDVFCTGGGMELDVESQENHAVDSGAANSFVPRKRPNTSGRVSVEHPNGEHPSRTLFVRNINSSVEDSELTALFEPFGEIRSLYTACKSRGFVMISYYDIRAAHAAMRALQNTLLRKRTLDIHFSIPKENPSEKDMNQGTLVIFNVDTTVSNDELLKLFGAHGEIREIRETPNRSFHRFIEYYDVRDAESALKALDRSEIGGKCIKLELSRPGGARRVSVPSTSQDLDRNEIANFFNQVANSPPAGNWPVGSPVKGSPSHTFPRPHGLGNMPGLASILPGHQPSRYQGLLNHPNQTILNKGLLHNVAFGQPHSLPDHIGGGISNSMRFIAPPHSSGFGTSSDNRYRWGSPPQHFNYPGYTGASSSSSSSSKHGFPFAERQGSLLGKYQHHVGSAPSSSHFNTHMNRYAETSSLLPLGFGDMGINKSYTNAHGQANVGVNFTGSGMSLLPTIPFGGSRGLQSVRHEPFAEQGRITHFETQLTDGGRYHIDLDRIATGDDTRTTLIIKNIPNKYTYMMLVAEIDEKHKGDYDFLCLPIEFRNKCNMGYAFVNMVSPLHIVPFQQTFNGKVWENFNSGKVASLAYAEIQGKSALASYMQNPSPMKDEKHLFPEVSHHNGDGQDSNDQERLLSSIWNLTAPDPDWSYTADKNVNSKNIVEDEST